MAYQTQQKMLLKNTYSLPSCCSPENKRREKLEARCQSQNATCNNKVMRLESSLKSFEKMIQEDQTKLTAVESKLAEVEKYGQDGQAKLEGIEVTHLEQAKKMSALEGQLQQQLEHIQSVMVQG